MKLGFPIKNKIALSVVLIPSLFFCSCFIPSKYPDEWAPIQKFTSECADISGFYDNLPEEFRNQPELSLGYLFQVVPLIEFYKRYHDHPTLSQIVIQFELISDEKIKTIARRGNITLGEKVLVKSSGDFDCVSGNADLFINRIKIYTNTTMRCIFNNIVSDINKRCLNINSMTIAA